MSLADRLAEPAARPRCAVRTFLAGLPTDDQAVLTAALADPAMQHSQIYKAVRAEYPDVYVPAEFTWGRHRRGDCSCGPT